MSPKKLKDASLPLIEANTGRAAAILHPEAAWHASRLENSGLAKLNHHFYRDAALFWFPTFDADLSSEANRLIPYSAARTAAAVAPELARKNRSGRTCTPTPQAAPTPRMQDIS